MGCERGAVERRERRRLCDGQARGKLRASLIASSHVMSNARVIVVALICASPAVLLFDGPIMDGLVAGVTAVGIAIVSRRMRPRETEFFRTIALPVAALVVVPFLWMLIQVLPVRALAHPIWTSAEAALGHPIAGAISIDLERRDGESDNGHRGDRFLVRRRRGRSATRRMDPVFADGRDCPDRTDGGGNELLGLNLLNASAALFKRTQAIDCVAMGVRIAAAATIRTLERYETRHASRDLVRFDLVDASAACIAALVVCAIALMLSAPVAAIVATGYGVAALAAAGQSAGGFSSRGCHGNCFARHFNCRIRSRASQGCAQRASLSAFATQVPAFLIPMSQRILETHHGRALAPVIFGDRANLSRRRR